MSINVKRVMPKAVIFDLDGTLVSSGLDFNAIREQAECPQDQDILRYIQTLSAADQARVAKVIHEHEMADAQRCERLFGVEKMLTSLAKQQIRTAIVTRNSGAATAIKLARAGMSFEHVITREDAPPKPAPDALLDLARAWGLETLDCVYVGDYVYDLEAAHRANMHACLYASKAMPNFADRAHFVYQCHTQFESAVSDYWQQLNRQ